MNMRAVVADDEPLALERLTRAVESLPGVTVVGSARDGEEAAEKIAALAPDVVFLDVQMPARNGLAVAAGLRREGRPEVIFVSAFEHHAAGAFEVDAADYLLKPLRPERLQQAVERARRRRELRLASGLAEELKAAISDLSPRAYEPALWVPDEDGWSMRLPVAEIDWIEAARDYVRLQAGGRSFVVRSSMEELAARLDPALIMRVHRSAFVRLGAVRALRRSGKRLRLVIGADTDIPVGASYAQAVLRALDVRG